MLYVIESMGHRVYSLSLRVKVDGLQTVKVKNLCNSQLLHFQQECS